MLQIVFVHTVGPSEPSSYTFAFSKAAAASGGILAYGGVDPTSPIDSAAGLVSGSLATITAPSIATNTPNAMLVAYFGIARITSLSQPAPMTERFESTGSSAVTYKISSAAAEEALGAQGPTGDRTAIAGGAAGNIGQLVALRAAGSSVLAAFDGLPLSGVAPLTVSFSDTSVGSPSAWAWDFDGNGTVDSTEQNPTHTFTQPGAYTVALTVTTGTDSNTAIKTDVVLVDAVPASSPGDPVLVGAGDIADCTVTEDEATAALLDGLPGTVFTLGDNVYETGTTAEWMN